MQNDSSHWDAIRAAAQSNIQIGQALLRALEQAELDRQENQWISLEAAAAQLGEISAAMLKQRCKDGRFKHGIHFINTSDGDRPEYLVKLSAVRRYFETDPARRPPAR